MYRTRRLARALSLLLVIPALAVCGDDPLGPQYPEDTNFAPELGIDLSAMTRLDSGVYIQTLTEGTGGPVETGLAEVTYTLWLPNGAQLQTGTFSFTFGLDEVIDGFEEGVSGMRVGEVRRIIVPSELGYGAAGQGEIPPHSVLIFEVELLSGNEPA